jgi:hypothetical protein
MRAPFVELEEELHRAATMQTGLDDFGAADYRSGLKRLLAALDRDPKLTETGCQFAYGMVLGTLTARLLTQQGWSHRPDCLAHPIQRPLVITGMPRTGTTALHKLLSVDTQFQGLEHWLTESPMVRPPRASWAANPAFQASLAALDAYFKIMPEMRRAHDIVVDEVDECLEVLRQSFISNRFGAAVFVPSYDEWFFAQDERDSYRRYADVLRLIGADDAHRRWLLKNPGHIAQIDALLMVFPDACIVQTHRDPLRAIPSLCSTLHMSRRMFEGDAARLDVLGPRECAYWQRAVDHAEQVRRLYPEHFHDVDHRRLHADPLGTVRGIYERFGLTLTAETERLMRQWVARNPTTAHGEHRYQLTSYGINERRIRDDFAAYRERHRFS